MISYSQEKDIWNYLDSVWKFAYIKHGRINLREKLLRNFPQYFKDNLDKAKTKNEAKKKIIKYLDWYRENHANTTPVIIDWLQKNLNSKKDEIIHKLEGVYKEKFPFEKIIVYLTTVNIFPYNFKERWFMSGKNQDLRSHIKIALHELNHFMFYYYYSDLKKELGNERYEVLKEALAIYTNPGGNDKPAVKKLENYFKENLNKSIPDILKKGKWRNYLTKGRQAPVFG